jgi:hypothetical protein
VPEPTTLPPAPGPKSLLSLIHFFSYITVVITIPYLHTTEITTIEKEKKTHSFGSN